MCIQCTVTASVQGTLGQLRHTPHPGTAHASLAPRTAKQPARPGALRPTLPPPLRSPGATLRPQQPVPGATCRLPWLQSPCSAARPSPAQES